MFQERTKLSISIAFQRHFREAESGDNFLKATSSDGEWSD